jgi:hypothetical protein
MVRRVTHSTNPWLAAGRRSLAKGGVQWFGAASLAIAATTAARAAEASETREPIQLEYTAPPGCPDRGEFQARLASAAGIRFVAGGATSTVDVRIEDGTPLVGRLVVRQGDEIEGSREARAGTCSALVEALVLMVDLAVDPPAADGRPGNVTIAQPVAPAAGNVEVAANPSPPSIAPADHPGLYSLRTSETEPTPAVRLLVPRTLYVGADAALATAVSPHTLAAPAPYVGLRLGTPGPFQPVLRIAFLYATDGTIEAASGSASFHWTVFRVDGSALSLPLGPVHLLACLRLEAGTLTGAGAVVLDAERRTRMWLAAGPVLRAEWAAIGALFLDVDASAMLHFTDDRFYFAPDATVYSVPLLGVEAAAGLGVHFL